MPAPQTPHCRRAFCGSRSYGLFGVVRLRVQQGTQAPRVFHLAEAPRSSEADKRVAICAEQAGHVRYGPPCFKAAEPADAGRPDPSVFVELGSLQQPLFRLPSAKLGERFGCGYPDERLSIIAEGLKQRVDCPWVADYPQCLGCRGPHGRVLVSQEDPYQLLNVQLVQRILRCNPNSQCVVGQRGA